MKEQEKKQELNEDELMNVNGGVQQQAFQHAQKEESENPFGTNAKKGY